jgi:hypothetical protein
VPSGAATAARACRQDRREQGFGAAGRARGIGTHQGDGADRAAGIPALVHQHTGLALLPQLDRLAAVHAREPE